MAQAGINLEDRPDYMLEAFLDEQHPLPEAFDLDPQLDAGVSTAVISGLMVVPPLVTCVLPSVATD